MTTQLQLINIIIIIIIIHFRVLLHGMVLNQVLGKCGLATVARLCVRAFQGGVAWPPEGFTEFVDVWTQQEAVTAHSVANNAAAFSAPLGRPCVRVCGC